VTPAIATIGASVFVGLLAPSAADASDAAIAPVSFNDQIAPQTFATLASNGGASAAAQAIGMTSVNSLYWDTNGSSAGLGGTGNWLGAGNWNNSAGTGTAQSWTDGRDAFFDGTAGTVTVDGPVTASTLNFNVGGYTIASSGSTLTLANGNGIFLNSAGTTTISAPLSSTGLVLMGGGPFATLNLNSSTNSFSGGIDLPTAIRLNFIVDGSAGNGGNGAATIKVERSC
jgi:fibronectin-binding autotransporter adhesin